MEERNYLNVLLTSAGDNKDERSDLLASIDISDGDVVKGLVDFYLNMRGVKGSKLVESIGALIFRRNFFGKDGVCYSVNSISMNRDLLRKNSFYYSSSPCINDFGWSSYDMNLEITLDCVVGILSFSTYAEGARFIGCVLVSDFLEQEKSESNVESV